MSDSDDKLLTETVSSSLQELEVSLSVNKIFNALNISCYLWTFTNILE